MDDTDADCIVIANWEDECAIWPASRVVPRHWRACGVRGTRAECERYIDALNGETRAAVLRQRLKRESVWP